MDHFVLISIPFLLVEIHHKLLLGSTKLPSVVSVFNGVKQIARFALQIEITEHHSSQVGYIGDSSVAGKRGEKGDAPDDHYEILGLEREDHIHINDAIGKSHAISEQDPVNGTRGP